MRGENILSSFRLCGEPASWTPSSGGAAQDIFAIVDRSDGTYLGNAVVAGQPQIKYPASQWIGLDEDEQITVGGVSYRVKSVPESEEDGNVKSVDVSRL